MVRYLLIGLGKSNLAIANDLIKNNGKFDVFVDKGEVPGYILEYGANVYNTFTDLEFKKYNLALKSPGIPYSHPVVEECNKEKIEITNEIGYSMKYKKKPLIAITGTNGKTTTTSLIEHILNTNEQKASAVGNIGNSFLDEAVKMENILVTELSSFQLRDLKQFNPEIAVWLNIYSAHLDYHKTFEDYLISKKRVFSSQSPENLLIYNEDDLYIREAATNKSGNKKSFSTKNKLAAAYFDGEFIWIEGERLIHKNNIGIKGLHNIQNAMASILVSLEYSSKEDVKKGLETFNGVEHRLEKVIENEILKIYNDSKSTNITAVKAALSAFDEPVILMMGGLDRGNGYEELINEWSKVKTVVCFGESGKKIYDSAHKHTEAILEEDMEVAIEIAKSKASGGGVLLFSPGCASWDKFSNFEERGKYFKQKIING